MTGKPPSLLARTPAGRLEQLTDLYAPWVEDEDGVWRRDPALGVITRDQLITLLSMPYGEELS